VKKIFVLFTAIFAACASAPPPPPVMPSMVPQGVIESLCAMLHGQGAIGEVRVVRTTQPLITAASLRALAEQAFSSKVHESNAPVSASPLPVEVPPGSCIGRAVDTFDPVHDGDVLLLQLSVPFPNPFANGQPGVLARFSVANEAATWYWVPIGDRNGHWMAGAPIVLPVR